jgi:hypothetical protein
VGPVLLSGSAGVWPALTLILPSESVYGSQFLTSKLLKENKFE